MNSKENKGYIIGVDGGGAKTVAALADSNGRILKISKEGSSHPRNIGINKAIDNLVMAIERVLPKNKEISAVFLGLPAMEEEFKLKKEKIRKELLKRKKMSAIFKGKLVIGSDQLVGFRSGTDKKEGIVVIAGSGCAIHGWGEGKEVKVDGWGYLSELGSSFRIGQRALQEIFKDLDGRSSVTMITKLVFGELKVKNKESLIEKIYSQNPMDIVPSLAVLVDKAAERGDKIAKDILQGAAEELVLSVKVVIKKFQFQKKIFPVVLIGSMFKSKTVLEGVKKGIKKISFNAEFIRPQEEPVIGAVKLAKEQI
ncbi:MAG: BadF/BadG/BcrA/BcrD ATPase family protein [Candidatus Nealsonbacteria bacterium]